MVLALVLSATMSNYLAVNVFHVNDPMLIGLGVGFGAVVILYWYVIAALQALSKFTLAVVLNAVQAIIKCIFAIVCFFLLSPNATTAYLWYALAPIVATVVGLLSLKKYLKPIEIKKEIWQEIARIARFGAIAGIAVAVSDNIDVLMVNASLTDYETGLYAAASRVALMLTVFGGSFGIVFNTRVAKYKNPTDMKKYISKALLFSVLTVLFIPVGTLLAKPLLLLTAGSDFMGALSTMNYLIISGLVMTAAIPFDAVFYAVDFPAYFAIAGVIQTLVLIIGNSVLIPIFGIEGAGMAKLIMRVIVTLYTIIAAISYSKRQYE
jgi:O-antigen/teichoic acid export membrane protein